MESNTNTIDKNVFLEKFAALCELTGRQFSSATIDAYYAALADQSETKKIGEPISTDEFVEIVNHFFVRAYFPAPREFFTAASTLRKFGGFLR